MLLSFRFANHRSFLEEQQLNLTPIYPVTRSASPREAVNVVGIFGANASGKSNCLHALAFMRRMVIESDRAVEPEPGLGIEREPFRLDAATQEQPSRYVVDLSLYGVRHTYGFTVDDSRVTEEWLFHYPLRKRRRIFERDGDRFAWGEESRKRADLEQISTITAPGALFISTVARFNKRGATAESPDAQPLHNVYRWFLHTRARSRPGPRLARNYGMAWPDSMEYRKIIIDLLRAADVGIVDVEVQRPIEQTSLFDFDEPGPDITRRAQPSRGRRRLLFTHRGPHGNGQLRIEDESAGTQQLLDLAIDAALVLRTGGMMTVDEIDASLHPMLTAKLIGLFQEATSNPFDSQLVFTSHDATLLGTFDTEEILGRDEIWFTEKGKDGISTLYPLTDFKPRKEGENRQRRYLNGSYGGVPDLSSYLFEQAISARKAPDTDGS